MSHETGIETLIKFHIKEYLDRVHYFDRLYSSKKLRGIYLFDIPPSEQGAVLDYTYLRIDWDISQWGLTRIFHKKPVKK